MMRTTGLLVGLALAACGGAESKDVEEPEVEESHVEEEEDGDDSDDGVVSQQKLDEIKAFFDRKRRIVSRCWGDAIDAGEVDPSVRGQLSVWLTIQPDGAPTDVRIEESRPESETLSSCVLEKVRRWELPTVPREMEYAYQFAFERL